MIEISSQQTTIPPTPVSHLDELGHQKTNVFVQEFTKSICKGFLTGLVVHHTLGSRVLAERILIFSGVATALAADEFISELANELRYQHEYAREVWEHEFNAMGEIDEYVSYGVSRGLSSAKSREIADLLTTEPTVSVPYHLAFELGLWQPGAYKQKLKHTGLGAMGFVAGTVLSDATYHFRDWCSRLSHASSVVGVAGAVALCSVAILPVLAVRYDHISKVTGSRHFKLTAGVVFISVFVLNVSIGRLLK